MAAIYDTTTSMALSEGLQGCYTCDAAIQLARRQAEQRDEPVILADDDGVWLVQPDGTATEYGWIVEGRGTGGDWSREYVDAGGAGSVMTREEAEAAIDSLVETGFDRADLRVREL